MESDILLVLKVLEALFLYHPEDEIRVTNIISELSSKDEIIKLRKELRERIIEIEEMMKH